MQESERLYHAESGYHVTRNKTYRIITMTNSHLVALIKYLRTRVPGSYRRIEILESELKRRTIMDTYNLTDNELITKIRTTAGIGSLRKYVQGQRPRLYRELEARTLSCDQLKSLFSDRQVLFNGDYHCWETCDDILRKQIVDYYTHLGHKEFVAECLQPKEIVVQARTTDGRDLQIKESQQVGYVLLSKYKVGSIFCARMFLPTDRKTLSADSAIDLNRAIKTFRSSGWERHGGHERVHVGTYINHEEGTTECVYKYRQEMVK